jgi:hypothetical protein
LASVIALMERREARSREELDVPLEALRDAQERAGAGRERLDQARIAREELLLALAEEAEVQSGAVAGSAAPSDAPSRPVCRRPVRERRGRLFNGVWPVREGCDPRPPVWCEGLDGDALSGRHPATFRIVASAAGPVTAQELTAAPGQDASKMNKMEKTRHRAYALTARGRLTRERSVFTPASGPAVPSPLGPRGPFAGQAAGQRDQAHHTICSG